MASQGKLNGAGGQAHRATGGGFALSPSRHEGFSPAKPMHMRAFAEAWPDAEIVQQAVGQLPWGHPLALLDKLPSPESRRLYAAKAIEHNWSRNILVMQIEPRLLERSGTAVTNSQPACPNPCPTWRESNPCSPSCGPASPASSRF